MSAETVQYNGAEFRAKTENSENPDNNHDRVMSRGASRVARFLEKLGNKAQKFSDNMAERRTASEVVTDATDAVVNTALDVKANVEFRAGEALQGAKDTMRGLGEKAINHVGEATFSVGETYQGTKMDIMAAYDTAKARRVERKAARQAKIEALKDSFLLSKESLKYGAKTSARKLGTVAMDGMMNTATRASERYDTAVNNHRENKNNRLTRRAERLKLAQERAQARAEAYNPGKF